MIWSIFSSAKDYPDVGIGKEDGFVDLTFSIFEASELESGSLEIIVKGRAEGEKLGFAIELLPNWKPQSIEGVDEPFYWGESYFKSTGIESKKFIEKLAHYYGAKISDFSVRESVHAQVVGLACNPERIKDSPCRMKFSFNSDDEENNYSEVFVNVDLQKSQLEFNEKDIEYRVPLLRSLVQ